MKVNRLFAAVALTLAGALGLALIISFLTYKPHDDLDSALVPQVAVTQPHSAPAIAAPASPADCVEGEPCWNCETMGNGICGLSASSEPEPATVPFAPAAPGHLVQLPRSAGQATIYADPAKEAKRVSVSDSSGIWQQQVGRLALLSCNSSRTVCTVRDMDTGRVGTADGLAIYAD